jgi:transcriptional regulator with XRE-family HTH domain
MWRAGQYPQRRLASALFRVTGLACFASGATCDTDLAASVLDETRSTIRCTACKLNQFRTRSGSCRRCSVPYPSPKTAPEPVAPTKAATEMFVPGLNAERVRHTGSRIEQLRIARGWTQAEMQRRSRVSRSYLSRIEDGQMTPSLGTLEKLATTSGVGLAYFFSDAESPVEDPLCRAIAPYVKRLTKTQRDHLVAQLRVLHDMNERNRSAALASAQGRRRISSDIFQTPRRALAPASASAASVSASR